MIDRNIENLPHEPSGYPLERAPQVDPMLQERRASTWRIWGLGFGIAVILAVVIYGIGAQHAITDSPALGTTAQQNAQRPSGPSNAPQSSPDAVQTQGRGGAQPNE